MPSNQQPPVFQYDTGNWRRRFIGCTVFSLVFGFMFGVFQLLSTLFTWPIPPQTLVILGFGALISLPLGLSEVPRLAGLTRIPSHPSLVRGLRYSIFSIFVFALLLPQMRPWIGVLIMALGVACDFIFIAGVICLWMYRPRSLSKRS